MIRLVIIAFFALASFAQAAPQKKPVQSKAVIRPVAPIQWVPANNPVQHWQFQNRMLWQYQHAKQQMILNHQLQMQQQFYYQQLYLQWIKFWANYGVAAPPLYFNNGMSGY